MLTVPAQHRVNALLKSTDYGSPVTVRGWVRTRRDSKAGFSFLEVNDGSCMASIQVIAEAALPNYESEIKRLTTGCSVVVEGELRKSPAEGPAGRGGSPARSRSSAGSTTRLPTRCRRSGTRWNSSARSPHLRPRTNTIGAVARVRNAMAWAVHEFFQANGFLYLHAPIYHVQRLRGRRADVRRVHAGPGKAAARRGRQDRFRPGLLRSPGGRSPSAASSKRRLTRSP